MKTARTRKGQINKANYMSDEAFGELKAAMEEALAFERGEHNDLQVTRNEATATINQPPRSSRGEK